MQRPLVTLLLLLFGGTSLFALARGFDGPKEPAEPRTPLVIVDRSGFTLLGPTHMHLLVYSDGHVAYVSRSGAPDDNHNLDRQLDPEIVRTLHGKLIQARALTLRDATGIVTDVPLNTVTVFDAKTQTSCNTFRYWIGADDHEPIEAALRAFVKDHVLGTRPSGRR